MVLASGLQSLGQLDQQAQGVLQGQAFFLQKDGPQRLPVKTFHRKEHPFGEKLVHPNDPRMVQALKTPYLSKKSIRGRWMREECGVKAF